MFFFLCHYMLIITLKQFFLIDCTSDFVLVVNIEILPLKALWIVLNLIVNLKFDKTILT